MNEMTSPTGQNPHHHNDQNYPTPATDHKVFSGRDRLKGIHISEVLYGLPLLLWSRVATYDHTGHYLPIMLILIIAAPTC